MMKILFKAVLLMSCFTAWSQVGIGTHSPHKSAVLEVSSNTKGILLPTHEFKEFNSNQKPIVNPQIGTLVYNFIDGNHSDQVAMKGIYVWDGSKWNQLLNDEGVDKLTTIRMMGGTIDQNQEILIKPGYLGLFHYLMLNKSKTEVITSSSEGGVTVVYDIYGYGQEFKVPKGYYKVEVSIDGWNHGEEILSPQHKPFLKGSTAGSTEDPSLGLYVKECVITDSSGNNLVEPKIFSIISRDLRIRSIQGYTFTFFLKIEETQNVKIGFNIAEGTSYKEGFRVNQNGVSIKFRRFFD